MKYLRFMLGVMLVVTPVLFYLFWPGDEDKIRAVIEDAIMAAEAGDPPGVLKHVSLNYHDDRGMSYLFIKRIAEHEMKKNTSIKVEIVSMKIRTVAEKAYASLELRITAIRPDGSRGYWLGDEKGPFFMELELKNEKPRGWKVYSGKYGWSSARRERDLQIPDSPAI